jgi:hypothetical protein
MMTRSLWIFNKITKKTVVRGSRVKKFTPHPSTGLDHKGEGYEQKDI